MKRHTFLFLLACLMTAVLTVPAAAVEEGYTILKGFYPAQVSKNTATMQYCLSATDAVYLALAAYDADGRQVGFTMAPVEADGQLHELSLTARRTIDTVKLYQLGDDRAPTAPAETVWGGEDLFSGGQEFAYLYDYASIGSRTEEGDIIETPYARILLSDGTKAYCTVAAESKSDIARSKDSVISCTIDNSGKLSLVPSDQTIITGTAELSPDRAVVTVNDTQLTLSGDTRFVFHHWSHELLWSDIVPGYTGAKYSGEATFICDGTNVLCVFVPGKNQLIPEPPPEPLPQSSRDVAYVLDIEYGEHGYNEDGRLEEWINTAHLLLADGTQASYPIGACPELLLKDTVIAYHVNRDGRLSSVTPGIRIFSTRGTLNAQSPTLSTVTASENTVFHFICRNEDGTWTTSTQVGVENVQADGKMILVFDSNTTPSLLETAFVLPEKPAEPVEPEIPDAEPVLVATIISDNRIDTRDLYLTEVDPDFQGLIDDKSSSPGDIVNFYRNADGSITATVLSYRPYQITGIFPDMVELNHGRYEILLENFADFAYEVEDYILAVLDDTETQVLFSQKAEVISGRISAQKSTLKDDQFRIDGVFYTNVSGVTLKPKDEITAVLNLAGQIALVEFPGRDFLEGIAYVDRLTPATGELNEDGFPEPDSTRVWLILPDGSEANYLLSFDTADQVREGDAIRYRIEEDGRLTRLTNTLTITAATVVLNGENRAIDLRWNSTSLHLQADNQTRFVFVSRDEEDTLTVTTATGVQNVNVDDKVVLVYDPSTLRIHGVFVQGKQYAPGEKRPPKVHHGIVLSESYSVTDEYPSGLRYVYLILSSDNGTTSLPFSSPQDFATFDLIGYTMENETACVVPPEMIIGTVESLEWEYSVSGSKKLRCVRIDGVDYTLAPKYEKYTVTYCPDLENHPPTYVYNSNLTEGAKIYFLADEDQAIYMAFFPILSRWNPDSNSWDYYYPT